MSRDAKKLISLRRPKRNKSGEVPLSIVRSTGETRRLQHLPSGTSKDHRSGQKGGHGRSLEHRQSGRMRSVSTHTCINVRTGWQDPLSATPRGHRAFEWHWTSREARTLRLRWTKASYRPAILFARWNFSYRYLRRYCRG